MREQFENMPEVRKKLKDLHPTIVWFSDQENEYASSFDGFQSMVIWLNGAWYAWQAAKAQEVLEGFVLVKKEPDAALVNHGHQVFLGHFNEGGQTGGRSLYFAYKAMIGVQESKG